MTVAEWIALVGVVMATISGVWKAFTWLVEMLMKQSRATIDELKEDRDELRDKNQRFRDQLEGKP